MNSIAKQPLPVQIFIDHRQLENVKYFGCLRTVIINDTRYRRGIKSTIAMAKTFFHQQTGLKFKEEVVKCYIWSIAFYGAGTCTLRKVD
jgi:hypothetical protein